MVHLRALLITYAGEKNFLFGCAFTARVCVAVTLASCACAFHSDSFEVRFGVSFTRKTLLSARLLKEEHSGGMSAK